MARRDIIVVGTSLGGLDALPRFVASLPSDLDAAVLVVMHLDPQSRSFLSERLDRGGRLRAADAVDGEPLLPGRLYVAIPDRHLLVEGDRIRLSQGPRESHARPAVDALFRSAAWSFGRRVVGVVLTGQLDDGTSGLWAIKDRGGVAIVQSPAEAAYPSMPGSALKHVEVDHTLTLAQMGPLLASLSRPELPSVGTPGMTDEKIEIETRIALQGSSMDQVRALGSASMQSCPDCNGTMVEIRDGSFQRFRCHTGHAYTMEALTQRRLNTVERLLFSALAQLEEHESLLRESEREGPAGDNPDVNGIAQQRQETGELAAELRDLTRNPLFNHTASAQVQKPR